MVLVTGRPLFHRHNRQKANANGQRKSPPAQGKKLSRWSRKDYTAPYHFISLPWRHSEQLLAVLLKFRAASFACTPLSV